MITLYDFLFGSQLRKYAILAFSAALGLVYFSSVFLFFYPTGLRVYIVASTVFLIVLTFLLFGYAITLLTPMLSPQRERQLTRTDWPVIVRLILADTTIFVVSLAIVNSAEFLLDIIAGEAIANAQSYGSRWTLAVLWSVFTVLVSFHAGHYWYKSKSEADGKRLDR